MLALGADPLDSGLVFAQSLLDMVSTSDSEEGTRRAPLIRTARLDLPGKGVSLQTLLGADASGILHPTRAFFDGATLTATALSGFSTRPCLIPTLWRDYGSHIEDAIAKELESFDGATAKVVVTGSLTDGIAAGMLVPVLDRLLAFEPQPIVSAVLYKGGMSANSGEADEPGRSASNASGVLATVVERYEAPGQYGLFRVALLDWDRQADATDQASRACWAFDRLFDETASVLPSELKEFMVDESRVIAACRDVERVLELAFSGLECLAAPEIVASMAVDPAARRFWGDRLPNYIEANWAGFVADSGSFDGGQFMLRLGMSLESLVGGLRNLFAAGHTRPDFRALRKLTQTLPEIRPSDASGKDQASVTAARLIFHILGSASR